jgi:hypothetical protein
MAELLHTGHTAGLLLQKGIRVQNCFQSTCHNSVLVWLQKVKCVCVYVQHQKTNNEFHDGVGVVL